MDLFNAEFEEAKEILNRYCGALFNLAYRLEQSNDSNADEIKAINDEWLRVSEESHCLMLTDSDQINKVRFVYAKSLKGIEEALDA